MKKQDILSTVIATVLIFGLMFIAAFACSGQTVVKEGNTFSIVKTEKTTPDTVKTVFSYKDSKNNIYPIYLNKNTGSCFIIRISGKTGNKYNQYMPTEVKNNICKYYNVTPKNK